jgi:hypothetical protein
MNTLVTVAVYKVIFNIILEVDGRVLSPYSQTLHCNPTQRLRGNPIYPNRNIFKISKIYIITDMKDCL